MTGENKQPKGLTWLKDGDTIHLRGQIDEFADMTPLLNESEPLRLNLKKVTRLNSIGVRQMLNFVRNWGPRKLVYCECPDIFIDQASMVTDLLGIGSKIAEIESFYVAYVCESCEHEKEFLIDAKSLKSNSLKLEEKVCEKCQGTMNCEFSPDFLQLLL